MFALGRNFSELGYGAERFSAECPRKGFFIAVYERDRYANSSPRRMICVEIFRRLVDLG